MRFSIHKKGEFKLNSPFYFAIVYFDRVLNITKYINLIHRRLWFAASIFKAYRKCLRIRDKRYFYKCIAMGWKVKMHYWAQGGVTAAK